jgi:hypothetical protein
LAVPKKIARKAKSNIQFPSFYKKEVRMLLLDTSPFPEKESFRAITKNSFCGINPAIVPDASLQYRFLQPFFDQLSYLYSDREWQKKPSARIRRYQDNLNKKRCGLGSCLSRGMLVAQRILHTQKSACVEVEFSPEVERTINILGYLFDSVCADLHRPSVCHKIFHARSLFTQIVFGLKPLETIRLEPMLKIGAIEDILKSKLTATCKLVGLEYVLLNLDNTIREGHFNFFLTDSENNGHYLIDVNFPIIQFKTRDDLINIAPKIVRTFFAKTNEIPQEELASLGFENHNFNVDDDHFVLQKIFTFQKVSYQIPETLRLIVAAEYAKSIWSLPYEIDSPRLENVLWKIQIQRIVYLVSRAIESYDIFHPPFVLSPLTDRGVKAKVLQLLLDDPIAVSHHDFFGRKVIQELEKKIVALPALTQTSSLRFLKDISLILKDQLQDLHTLTESGRKVAQFRFDDCLAGIMIPIL